MEIPKIFHQIWLDKHSMSQFFVKLTDTWKTKNPEWEHILWDKENAQSFLEEIFSSWLPFYEQLTYNVQRLDLLRYLLLIKHGEIYVNADYDCLDKMVENQELAFELELEMYTKFLQ